MKLHHVRLGQGREDRRRADLHGLDRERAEDRLSGRHHRLHNHGTIRIGDTFTEGEDAEFTGIPNFAPELFRRAHLRDPLKLKQLQKGLHQLCEEGATQLFRPLTSNDLILGAVGVLQFDVVAYRLKDEYNVDASFENVNVQTARWVSSDDARRFEEFRDKAAANLAVDHGGDLVYIAPTRVNLQMAQEKWPEIRFHATREQDIDAVNTLLEQMGLEDATHRARLLGQLTILLNDLDPQQRMIMLERFRLLELHLDDLETLGQLTP
jgi:peptide chain release factor 3